MKDILIAPALLLGLVLILSWGSFHNFFLGDDFVHMEESRVRGIGDVVRLFTDTWSGDLDEYGWDRLQGKSDLYRPLVRASFAVDGLLWGENPFGYHLTNVLLFWAAGLLVYLLARLLLCGRGCSLAASVLFLVHPSHIYPLLSITNRQETLVTLFGLASICSWIGYRKGRNKALSTLAAACYVGALLSKENGLGILPIIMVYDFLIDRKKGEKFDIASWAPMVVVTAFYLSLRYLFFGGIGGYLGMEISLASLWRGIRTAYMRTWIPWGYGLLEELTKPVAILFLLFLIEWMREKKTVAWVGFCVVGFWLALGPGVFVFYERLLCLSVAFFTILASRAVFAFLKEKRVLFIAGAAALLFLCGVWGKIWVEAKEEIREAAETSETLFSDLREGNLFGNIPPGRLRIYYLFLPDYMSRYGFVFLNGAVQATRLALESDDVEARLLSLISTAGGPPVLRRADLVSRDPLELYLEAGLLSHFVFPQLRFSKLKEGESVSNEYEEITVAKKTGYIREIRIRLLEDPYEGGRKPVFLAYSGLRLVAVDLEELEGGRSKEARKQGGKEEGGEWATPAGAGELAVGNGQLGMRKEKENRLSGTGEKRGEDREEEAESESYSAEASVTFKIK